MKSLLVWIASLVVAVSTLFGNGGAWQTGVPATGNASASKNDRHTDVTIENEALKIDLHPEYAAVEVRYRMHNTGPKVQQDFFFPVERWGENPDSEREGKGEDISKYRITVDGKDLPSTTIEAPAEKSSQTKEGTGEANQATTTQAEEESSKPEDETSEATPGHIWEQDVSTIKSWKKSVIPFERNQTREVAIHYKAKYAQYDESVSDDEHAGNATFAYSLSPAATWKGPIGKGKIEINILHPSQKTFRLKNRRSSSRKSAIRITNGTLKI